MKFDMFAQMMFERETGRVVTQYQSTATDMVTLVWACLQWEDETLTIKAVAQHIDEDNVEEIGAALDELNTKNPPLDVTGSNDGALPDTTSA